jgi:two-component system chemotaxis response regulator CheB
MDEPTKILVIDDSALYRQAISNVLRQRSDVIVVGKASNGVEALDKIVELDPDLLTLDVQMPGMDGIGVLREINKRRLRTQAIVVSSFTSQGAQITTDALLEGAFDFVLKPSGGDVTENRRQLSDALNEKVTAFRQAQADQRGRAQHVLESRRTAAGAGRVVEPTPRASSACRAVLMGASTGGPAALKQVLARFPASFAAPLLIVQHLPPQYTKSLAQRLNQLSPLNVVEANDGALVEGGTAMIAPGGQQMKLDCRDEGIVIRLTEDPPENSCRPSIDYLFRSAATVLDGNALGVIMTGMGRDGADGCAALKIKGGFVFAQHEVGCVVYGMPKVVIDRGLADRVLPLGKVAAAIVRHVKRSQLP